MTDIDLCFTPATELARMIRAKEISPVEIIQNSFSRITEVNPALNCFCFTYEEEALAKAKSVEADVMAGKDIAPLAGIPIAIKDFTPTKGKVTTRGSKLLENWIPDRNSVLVDRLEKAGTIMVGKTMTPEFATSGFTDSPLWGYTRNPWDVSRTTGGSSGGSGAAVASGCVPFAEGTDMGGSVRIPAALCGIVGLKPSLGRIPMDIIDNVYDNISHFGPLARTVSDATLFLDTVQGEHHSDIQSMPRCDLNIPVAHDVKGLKIALSVDLGFCAVDPGIAQNLQNVADALRGAGAIVEEVDLGWDAGLVDLWNQIWAVFMSAAYKNTFDEPLSETSHLLSDGFRGLIEQGQKIDATTMRMLDFKRTKYWEKLGRILDTHHALLCPTMAITAPKVEARDDDFGYFDDQGKLVAMDMTAVFNCMAQCPALSVPSGFANNMPTAAQIVARKWDDPMALRIGAAIETLMPWAGQQPKL